MSAPTTSPSSPQAAERVTIAMCTFRRPAAIEALASLDALEGISDKIAEVLVIDNDDTDAARGSFEEFATSFRFPLRYIHAPARNISIARNAALDGCATKWLAFFDDDELVTPGWLRALLARREGQAAVIGQVKADYGSGLPGWVKACDFHSTRIEEDAANGYAGNALIDVDFARKYDLRFPLEFGKTGGEDTYFFRRMDQLGGAIRYAPDAVIHEPVPQERASMSWVLRRKFRAGQTHGMIARTFWPQKYRGLFFTATAKMAFSALISLLTIPGSLTSRRWLARAALHAGAARYRLSPAIIEEYA